QPRAARRAALPDLRSTARRRAARDRRDPPAARARPHSSADAGRAARAARDESARCAGPRDGEWLGIDGTTNAVDDGRQRAARRADDCTRSDRRVQRRVAAVLRRQRRGGQDDGGGGGGAADRRGGSGAAGAAPGDRAGVLSVVDARSEYDVVVVDTAPTGHALRLLEMPDAARQWTQVLLRVLLKYKSLVRPGQLAAELVEISRSIRELQALLRDGRHTR